MSRPMFAKPEPLAFRAAPRLAADRRRSESAMFAGLLLAWAGRAGWMSVGAVIALLIRG